jgi:hypothetical protein
MTEINCRDDYIFREVERKVELLSVLNEKVDKLRRELDELYSIVNGIRDNGASSL